MKKKLVIVAFFALIMFMCFGPQASAAAIDYNSENEKIDSIEENHVKMIIAQEGVVDKKTYNFNSNDSSHEKITIDKAFIANKNIEIYIATENIDAKNDFKVVIQKGRNTLAKESGSVSGYDATGNNAVWSYDCIKLRCRNTYLVYLWKWNIYRF